MIRSLGHCCEQIPVGTWLALVAFLAGATPMASAAEPPELVLQSGHADQVLAVAFSPDGRLLASGSGDNTVKLIEVATGAVLRTLGGHSKSIVSVAFSPDGKVVAAGGEGYEKTEMETITLWSVSTGEELRTLSGHGGRVTAALFSGDGSTLYSGGYGEVRVWNLASGAPGAILGSPTVTSSTALAGTPEGTLVAAGFGDRVELLGSAGTASLEVLPTGPGVHALAISPDGALLAVGTWNGDGGKVGVWDLAERRELRSIETGPVTSLAFVADGSVVAAGLWYGADRRLGLWQVASGRPLPTSFDCDAGVWAVAASPDGSLLASGSDDGAVRVWDVGSGRQILALLRRPSVGAASAFSPDGRTLAALSGDGIELWDLVSDRAPRRLGLPGWTPSSLTWNAASTGLATGSAYSAAPGEGERVTLWDAALGTPTFAVTVPHNAIDRSVWGIALSPDGRILASGSGTGSVGLWDAASGELRRMLRDEDPFTRPANSGHGAGQSLAMSPDGRLLAVGDLQHRITLWDVGSGERLAVLEGHTKSVRPLAFSSDGGLLASANGDEAVPAMIDGSDTAGDDMIKLWDMATRRELRTLHGRRGSFLALAFAPDGALLATGGRDDTVRIWDVATGAEVRSLPGHTDDLLSLAFTPDGRILASGSADGTTKLWDSASWKELGTLITTGPGDWLFVTPSGHFDGTPTAWRSILWRFSRDTFDVLPVEAFFGELYSPGLLVDVFAGRQPVARVDFAGRDRRQPRLALSLEPAAGGAAVGGVARTATVRVEVAAAPVDSAHGESSGARDVRLFRNGSLVRSWRGDVLGGRPSVTLATPVTLVAGDNRLLAYGFNRDDVKSADATIIAVGPRTLQRQGVARVLAIGVDHYENPQYDLRYAVADAGDFAAELAQQQQELAQFQRVAVQQLEDFHATKSAILDALGRLRDDAQPEDAVIVYFAGHGVAHGDRFYLVPHDLGYRGPRTALDGAGLATLLAHGISDRELEEAFAGVDASRILLVVDACNSGQALEAAEKRRGPMNSRGLAQLAYEKGMYVLTAAQSYQAAQESSTLGHGVLTYVLVEEGLRRSAADDGPSDGTIYLREWLDYATARVPNVQLEEMRRALARGLDLSFAEEEGAKAVSHRVGQRPRIFYRREPEAQPFVVARTVP